MEYHHYSDMCMPTDPRLISDQYVAPQYAPQYLMPTQGAEYEVRNSVLVDGGDRFGVSAAAFDKYEELIWMGNEGGHVTSYYGPNMQKYTSFQVHESEGIRDIITVDQGIYVLTKTMLRHQIRRGLPKHTFRSPNMTDMQCLFQVSPTKLLMGGHQNKLLDYDLNKMKETVIPINEEGCAVIRSGGGSVVACGGAGGRVALRDIRSPTAAEHTFRAHSACLSDLDMQGDLLITCGFTDSAGGAVVEPYVVVWDVRRLRGGAGAGSASGPRGAAWSLPTASPPLLLHFLPAFSGRAVALAEDGHVALLHVNSPHDADNHSVFQVSTHNSQCSVMDVSSTSQALVFGDRSGHLHLFSPHHNHEPVFNNFSRATEFADQVVGLPFVSMKDTTFQFSSVPLPSLTTGNKWLNELPQEFYSKNYRKPKPIDAEVLKSMKQQGPIGYAPNPRTCKRNQMPYIHDTLEDLQAAKLNDIKYNTQPIPKHYLKIDLRYNKHNPNEVDLELYNKTGLPGLEATLPNSYCNSMLQVLYYTPPVKTTLLSHTCAREFCLSCELGFLFRTLDSSGGSPCQASNFLRAFRTVPEAAALGLIQPDRGPDSKVDLVALIQSWNSFILNQIHSEVLDTRKKEKGLVHMPNSSPPKQRGGNVAAKPTRAAGAAAATSINGQYEDYQYAELEFLGPATEFDGAEDVHKDGESGGWLRHNPDQNAAEPEQGQDKGLELLTNEKTSGEESAISRLFAIGRHQMNRCLKCNKEEERESVVLACALQYPGGRETGAGAAGAGGGGGEARAGGSGGGGFAELVRSSLAARRSTPAWCEHCARFTPTTQRGRVVRLPPILAINCGGVTTHEKAYWAKGMQKEMPDMKRGGSGKPCRYGLQCARPGCRFKHPERPAAAAAAAAAQGGSKSPESQCVLPHHLSVRLQPDGDILISDKMDAPLSEPCSPSRPDSSRHRKRAAPAPAAPAAPARASQRYALSAVVACVEDNPGNLVAYIRLAGRDAEPLWYLFNDLIIVPVSADEVVRFTAWWKSPCVLYYSSTAAAHDAHDAHDAPDAHDRHDASDRHDAAAS